MTKQHNYISIKIFLSGNGNIFYYTNNINLMLELEI